MSSAAGILLTHADRALFLKRSDKSRDHAGEWCCPGGSLEDGETPEQAARREMQEETGLTGLLTGNLNQIDEGNGFVTFRQFVEDEPTPTLNDEHSEAIWAPMSAPPQPLHPGVASTLNKLMGSAADAVFREEDHPRDDEGKFGSGGTSRGSVKLTAAEKSYVSSYSGDDFLRVNKELRAGNAEDPAVKKLDSAIAKSVLPDGKPLYRGMTREAAKNLFSGGTINKGDTIADKGFVSTSKSESVARMIGIGGVMLKIETGGGAHGLEMTGLSHNEHEQEVILPRDAKMTVLGVSAPKNATDPVVVRVAYGSVSGATDGAEAEVFALEDVGNAQDRREYDTNGWYEVLDNPLSGIGVYEYSEASVIKGGDRNKMVGVFRPPEELSSQACIDSFKLMPWTDDHPQAMLGEKSQGLIPAEEKGIHGVIGEKVYYKDGTLYGNIKVFSQSLARKIASGKKELSVGYWCQFVPSNGVYEGTPYQYVQRGMRGNHLSSVPHGKMGDGARVMDAAEARLSFALDLKEDPVVPEKRQDEINSTLDADTHAFIADSFNSLVGKLEEKGYTKEYATKVAGKVAAEKGMTGHDSIQTGVTTVAEKTKEEMEKDAKDRRAARDSMRSARDSMRAKDSMSSEEEMAEDAKECAEDAEEEKDDEKDETKEAKDRSRARDKRAGARDARKMARDRSARDAARDAAKGKGMDEAAVTAIVHKTLKEAGTTQALDAAEIIKQVSASVVPAIRKEESAKATLYGRVSPIVGAFDHAEMTHVEMAAYALDKMGAPKATDPVMALDFYLAGRGQGAAPQVRDAALDAVPEGSFLHRYMNS